MSNGNIYDPTAQVGTAIAERKYKKTQADIERRKAWAETGRDSVWEVAKAGSKFQRERMNAKMFGAKVPGLGGEVSMYKLKTHDNFLDSAKNKIWRTEESYELTGSAERYLADLEKGTGSEAGIKALEDLTAEYPKLKPEDALKHFRVDNLKSGPSPFTAADDTTKAFGWGKRALEDSNKLGVLGKGLVSKGGAGLQVGTGLYSLTNPKSSTAQQLGGAAQVALGVNAGLQAFGMANAWNPAGWGSLAASFGASLFQSGAFG